MSDDEKINNNEIIKKVEEKYISVDSLTTQIKRLLDDNTYYYVTGEIIIKNNNNNNTSSVKSSHFYFDLKDINQKTTISCAIFNYETNKHKYANGENIINGCTVKIIGKINYYFGKISIAISSINIENNNGLFFRKKEEIYNKLNKLNYFDKSRKKIIDKKNIKKIGLITSSKSDAMFDFIKNLKIKKYNCEIYLISCLMQGFNSDKQIISAIEKFNSDKIVDVIIITRGGGSINDLSQFDDEYVVNSVYNSVIPIICGIGHEKDNSLCDLVCDHSVSTPTGIANFITDGVDLTNELNENKNKLVNKFNDLLHTESIKLNNLIFQFDNKMNNIKEFLIDKYNNIKKDIETKNTSTPNLNLSNVFIDNTNITSCKEFESLQNINMNINSDKNKNKKIKLIFSDGTITLKLKSYEIENNIKDTNNANNTHIINNTNNEHITLLIKNHKLDKKIKTKSKSKSESESDHKGSNFHMKISDNITNTFNISSITNNYNNLDITNSEYSQKIEHILDDISYFYNTINKFLTNTTKEITKNKYDDNFNQNIENMLNILKIKNNELNIEQIKIIADSINDFKKHVNYFNSTIEYDIKQLENDYILNDELDKFDINDKITNYNYIHYNKLLWYIDNQLEKINNLKIIIYYNNVEYDYESLMSL